MNKEPFGKKCSCSHFESEHVVQNNDFSEPNTTPEMRVFLPLPPS